MAKIIFIAVICMLGATLVKGVTYRPEDIQQFFGRLEECRAENGAASPDVDEMIKKLPASNKAGLCMRACVMKRYDVMDANGKFNPAIALEHAKKFTDNDSELSCATSVIEACAPIEVPADHCDASGVYMKCFKERSVACGIDNFEL